METVEAIPGRSSACELIGTGFNSQIGDEIQRLISVPPETGNSFTALLELPANQAVELLIHSPEEAANAAQDPSAALAGKQILQCGPSSAELPVFPSDAALIDRAPKFSSIMSSDGNSRAKLEIVKEEPLDSVSNPNSNSSPAASNPAVDQHTKPIKRKDREKKVKEEAASAHVSTQKISVGQPWEEQGRW